MKKHLFILVFITLGGMLSAINNVDYIGLINGGQLSQAQKQINDVITSGKASNLEKAIAYKHLGTVLFRLGESFIVAFEN